MSIPVQQTHSGRSNGKCTDCSQMRLQKTSARIRSTRNRSLLRNGQDDQCRVPLLRLYVALLNSPGVTVLECVLRLSLERVNSPVETVFACVLRLSLPQLQ